MKHDYVEHITKCITLARKLRFLNAFITETFDTALEKARSLAEVSARNGSVDSAASRFVGSPIAIKDCFSTRGTQTTCGSKMLEGYVPPYTATVVQRLLDAGGLMVGKTNLDEFCMGSSSTQSHFGPVKNPWSLNVWKKQQKNLENESVANQGAALVERLESDWFITGGSSGGSAVAVACAVARIALGSDTGGSTRNPAAFCGVVGLKPTYGLLSRHGLVPLVNSLDVPGIFARNTEDVALALDIVAGRDKKDSTSVERPVKSYSPVQPLPRGLRIGIPKEYNIPGLSSEVWTAWNDVATLLEREAGCSIRTVSLPHTQHSIVCYHVIGECDVASNMARYDGIRYGYRASEEKASLTSLYAQSRQTGFNEVVRRRILAGNYFLLRQNYEKYFVKAMQVRRLIAEDFGRVFKGQNEDDRVDVLLTPATSTDAPLYSEFVADDEGYDRERQDDFFTQPANMAGVPALSLPIRLSTKQLPLSLQLIGNSFEEQKLLSIAKWIEHRMQFPHLNMDQLI